MQDNHHANGPIQFDWPHLKSKKVWNWALIEPIIFIQSNKMFIISRLDVALPAYSEFSTARGKANDKNKMTFRNWQLERELECKNQQGKGEGEMRVK